MATQGTLGAGSAIGTQIGYYVSGSMTGATNNFGFRGSIPSGTGRWNIYMDGTALNYLNGSLLIKTLTDDGVNSIQVNGSIKNTPPAMITTPTLFYVDDFGVHKTRTAAQMLSDIGASPASGSANYIQNQTAAAQTATYNITSTSGTFTAAIRVNDASGLPLQIGNNNSSGYASIIMENSSGTVIGGMGYANVGVAGDRSDSFYISAGSKKIIFCPTGATAAMAVLPSNNIVVGALTDNGARFQVTGQITATGNIQTTSNLVGNAGIIGTNTSSEYLWLAALNDGYGRIRFYNTGGGNQVAEIAFDPNRSIIFNSGIGGYTSIVVQNISAYGNIGMNGTFSTQDDVARINIPKWNSLPPVATNGNFIYRNDLNKFQGQIGGVYQNLAVEGTITTGAVSVDITRYLLVNYNGVNYKLVIST
jgi:hypothetical protein